MTQSAPNIPRLWTRPFTLICLAHFILNIGFHACMPVYPLFLGDRFGLQGVVMGVAVAIYAATAIFTRPPTGYCVDRFGRRAIYLCSYFIFAFIYLLYPLASGALSVICIRSLHGALWGVTMGSAATASVDLLPAARRGEGIAYFGLAMVLGMACGPAVGFNLAGAYGYTALFVFCTFITLAGFTFLCFIAFPHVPRRIQPVSVTTLFEKTSLPVSLATMLFCMPFSAVMNFSGLFARSLPGASAGVFYLLLALSTALSRVFSGKAFDRHGPAAIMGMAYALLLCGCLAFASAKGSLAFYFGSLCMGFGFGIAIPVMSAMINALVPPERRGAANATFMTAFDLGICLGLVSISGLQENFGWSVTYLLLFGCVLASALVFRLHALPEYRAGKESLIPLPAFSHQKPAPRSRT